jgi:hypothetical protein
MKWEHIGEKGKHEGHQLYADDMQDVHCIECGECLTDDEAEEAWPV